MATPARPVLDDLELLALVVRAAFGFDAATWSEARSLGRDAWLEWQLDPAAIHDTELETRLAGIPSIRQSADEISADYRTPALDLRAACVLRGVFTRRVLFERTVEFWNDHFHVDQSVAHCRIFKTIEDREVIRAHAFGRFGELLAAVTRSAAMLDYLDNVSNRKEAPNENFARELLELHTLGVGHYDEHDVREVARCFTGWTRVPETEPHYGEFRFRADWHDDGAKRVLGVEIPAGGGVSDGERVLALLAEHPATARRIATRLAVFFLSDEPPSAIVEEVARAFTASRGDIRTLLRVLLSRESIALACAGTTRKYKRPFAFVASLLRATNAEIEHARGLCRELAELGHAPFVWPAPDGYPQVRATWESALLSRWTFVERLFTGAIDGVRVDADALLAGVERAEVVAHVDSLLTGGTLSDAERKTLAACRDASAVELCTLVACAPSFQEVWP